MRKVVLGLLAVCVSASIASGQTKSAGNSEIKEAKRAALEEIRILKRANSAVDLLAPAPSAALFDQDSFGKSVVFLGSLYAGTVVVDDFTGLGPLNSNGCPTDPPFNFAPDDHCVQKTTGSPVPLPVPSPMPPGAAFITIFDPAWEVTIPGNTVKNVVYPMLNNNVNIFRNGGNFAAPAGSTQDNYVYVPVVTVVSDALNDPQAIVNGVPLNGEFTTSMTGSKSESRGYPAGPYPVTVPFQSESHSYASIAGRGISRDFWRAVGLPESVINNIYKKPMTLKFGIRFRMGNRPDSGAMFYTFRLLGQ